MDGIPLDSAIGLIAIVLVTLWGAFSGSMAPYREMNDIKKQIMDEKDPVRVPYLKSLLHNDWKTMCWGSMGFLFLVAVLLSCLPYFSMEVLPPEFFWVAALCHLTAALPAFGAAVGLYSLLHPNGEYRLMRDYIAGLSKNPDIASVEGSTESRDFEPLRAAQPKASQNSSVEQS